jgi:hypothetical protein
LLEGWIALGLIAVLGALGGAFVLPPELLLIAGFWVAVAGLGFGVPTGLLYHWALRRALAAVDRLPPRWWVHPTSLHDRLPPEARPTVMAWCTAGAAGFLVSLAGCALVALGAFRTG